MNGFSVWVQRHHKWNVLRYTCTSPPVVAGVSLHNNEPRDTVQRNTRDTVICNALTWWKARATKKRVNPPRRRSKKSWTFSQRPARRRNLRGVGLHAQRRRGLSKLKKTAPVGTLQKTGLELRRAIIKEVRGHFWNVGFIQRESFFLLGITSGKSDLNRKREAFAFSEAFWACFAVAVRWNL